LQLVVQAKKEQTMSLREEIHRQRDTMLGIVARHGATNLRLFGSVARGDERPDSDVDLLIDLGPDRGFADYLGLAEELEALLHRHVDLLLSRSLSPHFRPFIEAEARPV
jgi:predicted nucleotidyltransferase